MWYRRLLRRQNAREGNALPLGEKSVIDCLFKH